jgi:hypothetical protein
MRFRLFEQKDFGKTDGYCAYEGGEGLIYPPEFWESHVVGLASMTKMKC